MKALIQYDIENKFFNCLSNYIPENICANIDNRLYSLYFKYNFETFFFVADKEISRELNTFIIEFQETKKIFLYHKNPETKDYSKIFKKVIHLSDHGIKLQGSHVELPEYFVNEKLFNNENNSNIKDKYCVFLEMKQKLPESLESLLYPNSDKPINMFNSPHINHYQNMGTLSEAQKAQILKEYKYFINIDNNYIHEAKLCGCQIVEIGSDNQLKKQKIDTNAVTIKQILGDLSYE